MPREHKRNLKEKKKLHTGLSLLVFSGVSPQWSSSTMFNALVLVQRPLLRGLGKGRTQTRAILHDIKECVWEVEVTQLLFVKVESGRVTAQCHFLQNGVTHHCAMHHGMFHRETDCSKWSGVGEDSPFRMRKRKWNTQTVQRACTSLSVH